MNKFKFELNHDGVGQLLKCSEMQNALIDAAESVRPQGDYEVKSNKDRAFVIIKSEKTWNDNTDHNTLLKYMYGNRK